MVNRVSRVVQTAVPLGLVVAWGVLSNCIEPNPGYVRAGAGDGAAAADRSPPALDGRLVPHQANGDGEPAPGADAAVPDAPPGVCDLPHASGGSYVGGVCQGYLCELGWGDCNNVWSDGCEADLSGDLSHCGGCDRACVGGANATASCIKGQCVLSCTVPYEDCNADPTDGCEIPVGEPNTCGRGGLSTFSSVSGATPGCGTPYCGKGSNSSKIKSFGSWHCSFCAHCQLFDDGGAWCLIGKGTFSADRCTNCCNPSSLAFPQLCKP